LSAVTAAASVVKDGEAALDFVFCTGACVERRNGRPKLILLDLKLPKVDGSEVLRRLKSEERSRMIPLVMLTSSREGRDLVESYRLGVNCHIVKPVDFDSFVETVSKLGFYWSLMNAIPEHSSATIVDMDLGDSGGNP
jgi:two-component system, response regulator